MVASSLSTCCASDMSRLDLERGLRSAGVEFEDDVRTLTTGDRHGCLLIQKEVGHPRPADMSSAPST
jgi:hypothetical protein